jgi:hypothetical protein
MAMFYILLRLFPDRRVAQLATLLISMAFVFLWSSADGRPDAMANCLVICSIAAYLRLRETNLGLAILASQILFAAGVFAHLNALVVLPALMGMVWYFDRSRLKWHDLLPAAAPYIFFAALWSLYIMQKPGDFAAQFFPQAGWSERWKGFLRPDLAIDAELLRHLRAYYIDDLWSGVMNGWAVIIPLLDFSAVIWFLRIKRGLEKTERAFLHFVVLLLCSMTFLNGFKGHFYLIYIVPTYAAVVAAWLLNLWARSPTGKWAAAFIAFTFALLQLTTTLQHIRVDEYHHEYEPTIRALAGYRAKGKSIVGTAGLGFGLEFEGFKDDIREGTYSGIESDVLVIDRSYRRFAGMFEKQEPRVFAHIVTILSTEYTLTAQYGSFWIFERVRSKPGSRTLPWIDLEKMGTIRNGERADYLFRSIFTRCKLQDPKGSILW